MKKILIALSLILSLNACKNMDFGDLNKDPLGPYEFSPKDIFAGGVMNFFNNTGRDHFTNPTFYVQWQAQGQYTSEMQYADLPISWNPWYIRVLSNFEANIKFMDEHRNDQKITDLHGGADNVIAVNMIMKAYVAKFITDIYGDVPYSDALKGLDNMTPKYDKQLDIYKSVIADLETARDMFDPAEVRPQGDIIYNGDINLWKKLANSLIIHAALQISDLDPVYAQQHFESAVADPAGVIEDVDQEAWIYYSDQSTALRNPYSRLRRADYYLTKEFIDNLKGIPHGGIQPSCSPTFNHTFDDRFYAFRRTPRPGYSYDGKPYSCSPSTQPDRYYQMSERIWNSKAPLPFFTASWTYLDRAEGVLKGWNAGDTFDNLLTAGITKSFETLDAHYGFGGALTASGPAYAAARVADANDPTYGQNYPNPKLLVVAEEKWVAYFPMGFEGWAQWRRLDLPALTPHPHPLNATGQIPTRYKYPGEEQTINPDHYQSAVQDLNPAEDRNDSKVPWDVN